MNNKNFIIVTVVLLAAAIIGLMSYLPTRFDISSRVKVADFPTAIGEWTGADMPLSERDYQILETRNLFVRDYKNPKGESVYLYVVYSEDNRKASHPPEVCYMGSGVTIVDKSPIEITNSIRATKMIVEKADSRQLVVYWYKAGSLNTDKYLRQQIKIVIDRLLGKRTSGALIRVSTDVRGNNLDAAGKLLKSFCVQIEPLVSRYVP